MFPFPRPTRVSPGVWAIGAVRHWRHGNSHPCSPRGPVLLLCFLLNNLCLLLFQVTMHGWFLDGKIPREGTISICLLFIHVFSRFFFPPFPCAGSTCCVPGIILTPVLGLGTGAKSDKYSSVLLCVEHHAGMGKADVFPPRPIECGGNR